MKYPVHFGVVAMFLLEAAHCGTGSGSSGGLPDGTGSGSTSGGTGSTGSSGGGGAGTGSGGSTGGGTPSGSASGSGSSSSSGGSSARDAGSSDGSTGSTGTGPWAGLKVSGTMFVDPTGNEFIPRGIGVGELWNTESYMINVNSPDVKGMGYDKWKAALVAGMGQAATDTFFSTWEANIVAPSDVQLWASWGVNSIRLPIDTMAISSADGSYIEAGFQKIDAFVAQCKANNIYVILDLHAAPGAQNCEQISNSPDGVAHLWSQPTMYRQWTIDVWQTIAKRYANETAVGGYDIFDEPYDDENSGGFDMSYDNGPATLRQMYLDITTAIRSVDPNHIIFFEGTNWSSDDGTTHGFAALQPPWDPQMAWSFHKYWDGNTTAAIQPYLDLRTSSNRPVWNGETGEDNTTGWSGAMIALLEANHIGWNEWTYKKVANNANFYSITQPANWSATATYLAGYAMNGSGTAPSDLSTTMMTLAANAATSNCMLQTAWLKEIFNK